MTVVIRRFSTAFAFVALLALRAPAQTADCATALERAQRAYDAGSFREVLTIIEPCLEGGLSPDDRWRGYRFAAISHLLLDEQEAADVDILQMLSLNPQYRSSKEADPYEFTRELEHYSFYSDFSAGLFLQLYAPSSHILRSNTLTQTYSAQSDYRMPTRFNIGGELQFQFLPRVSVGADGILLYEQLLRNSQPLKGITSNYTENLSSFALPVFGRYHLFGSKFQPFAELGAFAQWLTSVSANVTLSDPTGGPTALLSDPDPGLRRRAFNYGVVGGLGVTYPFYDNVIVLRARYWHGMIDLTRASGAYTSPLLTQAYYMDDNLSLNGTEVTLGVNLRFGYKGYRVDE